MTSPKSLPSLCFLFPALVIALLGASAPSSRAAELRVRVVDRAGSGIPEAEVWVGPALEPGEARGTRPWRMKLRGVTDERGELVVPSRVGRWEVDARGMRLHAEPRFNPLQPPPVVTLREGDESVPVEVVAWEGGLVVFEPEVDGLESPLDLVVRATHLDAPEAPIEVEMDELREYVLPTGDWVFEPLVPGGHVLERFLVDGSPETKTRIEPTQVALFVQSLLVAESRIVVDMRWIDEKAQPTPMRFVPLEPGGLMEEAGARWVPPDERSFRGRAISETVYRATSIVPAGTWSVAPRLASIDAQPELQEFVVASGASRRIEFDLESAGELEDLLHVSVLGNQRRRIAGARVWLCEGEPDTLESCSSPRETGRNGGVNFHVPRESPRVLVVEAEGHVPQAVEAAPPPESAKWRSVEVRLRRGGRVDAEARDGAGLPVPGVMLSARQALPPTGLPEAALALFDWRTPRQALTDSSGRVSLGGLWDASVEIEARMTGANVAESFVDVHRSLAAGGGFYVRSLSVEPEERDPPFLRLRVRPAGSIAATLVCDDGAALPKTASVRAFADGVPERDAREEDDLMEGAACVLEPAPIKGAFDERLVVGPLEAGAFHVAIRPTRHARWSWVDVESREDAPLIPVTLGQTTEIGIVTLRCAPSFEIEVTRAGDGTRLPRAELVRARALYRRILPGLPPSDPRELFEEARPEHLRVTGFEEGRVAIEAALEHPLLPPEGVRVEEEATMRRGHLVPLVLALPRFLGAIDYAGDARALRVRTEAGEERGVYPVEKGRAIVPSLEPGLYGLELCADPECARTLSRVDELRVEEGAFSELR